VSDAGTQGTPRTPDAPGTVTVVPLTGIPEVTEGTDLADAVDAGLRASDVTLVDGDVLVVSSKVASKSLGLVVDDAVDKDALVLRESSAVVAERATADGRVTRVVRATAGPVMAAAGIDGSNTGARGGWLLLPHDPDAVCERLHAELVRRHGVRLGVVLSDTSARPWRVGHSDFALGAHGLHVVDDLRGGVDADGRPLAVTTRAVADEIASAADLAKGKASAVPVAVVRGLATLVLEDDATGTTDTGTDAATRHPRGRDLVRTGPYDWFGMGRAESVRAALGVAPGSAASLEVGVAPAEPGDDGALSRAVRVAMRGCDEVTADVGAGQVTLGAPSPYELGRFVARLEVALWGEWLEGEVSAPSADGVSVGVTVSRR
jgi:coenzyme F420-0:L-glutamate ligase/coenzyme F420-1:gamma-L-glutamate ligase